MSHSIRELAIAAGLGLLLLATGVLQQLAAFEAISPDWAALAQMVGLKFGGTPLGRQVAGFVVAQLLLHIALGVLCWLLAVATLRAFPAWPWRRLTLTVGWFVAAVLWLLLGNATLYPWSETGVHADFLRLPWFGALRLFDVFSLLLVAAIGVVLMRCVLASPRLRKLLPRIALYGGVVMLLAAAAHWRALSSNATPPQGAQPHIILVGIDSLRNDVVGEGRALGATPNIDLFLRDGAHTFSDAITPLARTFPAWTSILSGRYPKTTGARENLVGFDRLAKFPTLAAIARARGYHTILATDEVRFSNIDQSFGFDQLITPTIGAADFLLAKASDLPLTNMLANTRLCAWLFPATYANRAAAHSYRPEAFIERLRRELEPRGPTLLAVHFTLPHYPYRWADADDEIFSPATDRSYQYLNSVIAVDAQFGALLELLQQRGLLDNAVVVVLSDHGEALGLPDSDTLLHGAEARELLDGKRISLYGHGSSVLSPHQYQVLLAMRGYGAPLSQTLPSAHPEPVSLVDLAPTLLSLANIEAPGGFEGQSLRPLLEGDAAGAEHFANRARFTETGFRTPLLEAGQFAERGILGEAAAYFHMNAQSGRFEVRADLMPRLLADKERAALTRDFLLAAIPTGIDGSQHKYLLLDRRTGDARRLVTAPDAQVEPQVAELWRGFHAHYGNELLPPQP